MQIKVKDTKTHEIVIHYSEGGTTYYKVLVAEVKLVLVECPPVDAKFWKYHTSDSLAHYEHRMGFVKGIGKYLKPILISETEKIEIGDWVFDSMNKTIHINNNDELINIRTKGHELKRFFKILALPEHFSPKHLQAIVDGKLKDGDNVLVECEQECQGYDTYKVIKLDSFDYIILHKIKEIKYTFKEMLDFVIWYSGMEQQKVINAWNRYVKEVTNKI